MAITRLEVKGYRSFKHLVWEPGKLNLVVGPNGSGKSNLLRLFQFIQNIAQGKLQDTMENERGIASLLWNHEKSGSLSFSLEFNQHYIFPNGEKLYFEIMKHSHSNTYSIDKESLYNSTPEYLIYEKTGYEKAKISVINEDMTKIVKDINTEKFKNESLLFYLSHNDDLFVFEATGVIEDWRIFEYFDVHVKSPIREPVTTQPQDILKKDGANLASLLHTLYTTNRKFRTRIDNGMKAAFGTQYENIVFPPASSQRIEFGIQWRNSQDPHVGVELSDGTLRYLLLLTIFSSVHEKQGAELIAIDEPETGLHPSMFPIIAEYAAEAAERTQIIVTTHSPEFLDAFTDMDAQITVCNWEQGESRLYTISRDNLKPWLERYRLGELFTGGDLEILAQPQVDEPEGFEEKIKNTALEL